MALTRAEKTQLGVLETKKENSDTFGPLTPKEQKTLEELQQKQGNQSSLFDKLSIFGNLQASEINPNNPPSTLPTGAMDRETPFGDKLQPTIPTGGSIFSGRQFGNIRGGITEGSVGQRFNMENNPELFFNTEAGQAQVADDNNFFNYLKDLSGGVVDLAKDFGGRIFASNVGSATLGKINPILGGFAGITGLLKGGNLFDTNTLSQRRFDAMTPGQQAYTSSLYNRQPDGSPGLLQGYNQISAFGEGALGTLGNRLDTIQNTLAKQGANPSKVLQQREQQIKDAIDKSINIGESEALQDPNRNVGGIRTDIDVADGGAETSGGKIVCTMMNESYGFGNFRNKIWLRQSKDLAPEYQKGYHILFLPLVRMAKTNKTIKKVLEHIAVHRTIDIRQESRGKTHMLGRIYRKILEPICYWVGKYAKR